MTARLLAYLKQRANRRGLVLASQEDLLRELAVDRTTVLHTLDALESAFKIEVLAPLPYLVVKLIPWSGSNQPAREKVQQNSSPPARSPIGVPVSSSAAAAATQQREVGGAGEGEALLEEVLAALGPDANRDEFREILAGQPPTLIHRCLKRVRTTTSIRVSRAALFRSLLQKLGR